MARDASGEKKEPGHAWSGQRVVLEPSGYPKDRPKRGVRSAGDVLEAGWRRAIRRGREEGDTSAVLSGLDADFMRRTRFADLPTDEEEFRGLLAGGVALALRIGDAASFFAFTAEAYGLTEWLWWAEHEGALAEEFLAEAPYVWSRGG